MCGRNSDLKIELPILMNFTSAKRHDSINFLYAIDAFGAHGFGITPTNLCLNSAHDNLPTYRLLEHWERMPMRFRVFKKYLWAYHLYTG